MERAQPQRLYHKITSVSACQQVYYRCNPPASHTIERRATLNSGSASKAGAKSSLIFFVVQFFTTCTWASAVPVMQSWTAASSSHKVMVIMVNFFKSYIGGMVTRLSSLNGTRSAATTSLQDNLGVNLPAATSLHHPSSSHTIATLMTSHTIQLRGAPSLVRIKEPPGPCLYRSLLLSSSRPALGRAAFE